MLATGARPTKRMHALHAETVVPTNPTETFAFFSNAQNLERLTPPWINFSIRTPRPIQMQEGTIIDYTIVLHGVPIPWRTRIDVWEPGIRFVDRQLAGPYQWWRHEHRFVADPAGTRVIDDVEYLPRFAFVSTPMVSRDVSRIFGYRQQQLTTLLKQAAS